MPGKIVVTGAGGFIGAPVVRRLVDEHLGVRGIVRRPTALDGAEQVVIADIGPGTRYPESFNDATHVVHPAVHARLLRRMAHARGVARVDVCRHRPGGQGYARSSGADAAARGGAEQGGLPHARRRHARAQLLDPGCRIGLPRPQHLPAPGRRPQPSTSSRRPMRRNATRSI